MGTTTPLRPLLLFFRTACFFLTLIASPVVVTADSHSEVALWFESGMAVATSQLSGRREIPLGAQEVVMSSGTSGINGIVVTSRRLLGFSSRALTWTKKELDVNEKVLERKILPAFSLIRTDRHLYGFRGVNGLWLEEALSMREKVQRFHSNDYGAVFITDERLVGFSPLLGGFASKPLDVHEQIVGVENDNGLILVSTTKRTLVFGSRLSGWEEFE
ncbi:MAG: hypothetical protein A4E19_06315 [Nitrospira sp. SG-bin1]|nr:MAG: hypothetical protein A4E19_06315 [Nitrospira sp. SG-bin1]